MTKKRLIIIDDETGYNRLLQDDLETHDISVACLFSEKDAESALAFGPDAILADQNNLEIMSEGVLEKIAAIRPDIPVIMAKEPDYGAANDGFDAESVCPLHVKARIEKPYDPARLSNLIRRNISAEHENDSDMAYIDALVRNNRLLPNLTVEYQSKHSLTDGRLAGYEALTRLKTRRAISPQLIFSAAVDLDVEIAATLAVVGDAISLALALMKAHHTVPVSFNCSAVLLTQTHFVNSLAKMLEECEHIPNPLLMEITQESRVADIGRIAQTCHMLRDHNLMISIDGCGADTGNIDRVSKIPFSEVKIDKQVFWSYCEGNIASNAIRPIIEKGHSRGAKCVIEGIETLQQLQIAKELDADFGQGFHWGQAIPPQFFVSEWPPALDVFDSFWRSYEYSEDMALQ